MNKDVFISVLMPAYNAEKYIAEAIESVLAQTFSNFEFIISDDGSTDKTAEIVKSYKDDRINLIQNGINKGLIYTLNLGLDTVKGKYIARMDADDISYPERFEKQVLFLEENPDISILGTASVFMDDRYIMMNPLHNDQIEFGLIAQASMAHPTIMMRTESMRAHKLYYDYNYTHAEDYHLWTKAIKTGLKLANLDTVLLEYRRHGDQICNTKKEEQFVISKKIGFDHISYFLNKHYPSDTNLYISDDIQKLPFKTLLGIVKKMNHKNRKDNTLPIKRFNDFVVKMLILIHPQLSISDYWYVITASLPFRLKNRILRKYRS